MAATKEYTDYLITIWGAGERAFTDVHIQIGKSGKNGEKTREITCLEAKPFIELPTDVPLPAVKLRGIKYLFEGYQDWAFLTKFAPWRKVNAHHPVKSLHELSRAKRIGHLHYKEPCDQNCKKCVRFEKEYPDCHPSGIEPLHFSRIHQPSGRINGEPVEMVQDPRHANTSANLIPGLLESVTPRMLQNRIENGPKFYQAQYKSYRFGIVQTIRSRWLLVVIGMVVGFVVLLYFAGVLDFGGGT